MLESPRPCAARHLPPFFSCFLPSAFSAAEPFAFLDQHCVECHDADLKKGGIDLSDLETGFDDPTTFAIWVKVHDAIAAGDMPPPVFKRRIHPADLVKFDFNLRLGQFVLLKDKQPDPALPVRGGFEEKKGHVGDEGPDLEERRKQLDALQAAKSESAVGLLNPNLAGYEAALNVSTIYAGHYRMKLSLWDFQWNQGKPEAGPDQAAVLRAHE